MSKMSSTKQAALLVRVNYSTEITTDTAWLNELIDAAADFIVTSCRLTRYPETSQGYSQGATSPTTDLSALTTNSIWVSVNGSSSYEIEPTLANCTTGALTAAELQTQIRAVDDDGFDEVTVAYSAVSGEDTYYQITSGRYGAYSAIYVSFEEDYKHVAKALKLTMDWGGTEHPGATDDDVIDTALVELVRAKYAQTGMEFASNVGLLGGVSYTSRDVPSYVARMLDSRRKGWRD